MMVWRVGWLLVAGQLLMGGVWAYAGDWGQAIALGACAAYQGSILGLRPWP